MDKGVGADQKKNRAAKGAADRTANEAAGRAAKEAADAAARRAENERLLPKYEGCLIAGALGDALGYPVEFMSNSTIREKFGPRGISELVVDGASRKALISDDTQMTMFTANALLIGNTRATLRGIEGSAAGYASHTYRDWLHTQDEEYTDYPGNSWLLRVSELYSRRAPGNTCLQALYSEEEGSVEHPINNSKGCGGVMRVAPAGLFFEPDDATRQAAGLAALTHGHPLGYISAAALAYIVSRCAREIPVGTADVLAKLVAIVDDCCARLCAWFPDHPSAAKYQAELLQKALRLSKNSRRSPDNIRELGGGWVGEEALAIAVYACARHPEDLVMALRTAVNHDGDSDSTGAICGNILGAALGIEAVPERWSQRLELRDVIEILAKDLCDRCQMSEWGSWLDKEWMEKYGQSCMGSLSINDSLRGIEHVAVLDEEDQTDAEPMLPEGGTDGEDEGKMDGEFYDEDDNGKLSYLIKTLSRTRRKDYENYVVNAAWNRLGMPDVKPVSQQYVTSGDKGYFIDLYFPQLNIGIEYDELYHLGNVANDRRRERDLIDILNAIDVSSYRAVHIKVPGDAADQLSEFDKQINDAVSELRAEVGRLREAGSFAPWTGVESPVDYYAQRDRICTKDRVGFPTIKDACNILFDAHKEHTPWRCRLTPRLLKREFGGAYSLWFPSKVTADGKGHAGWLNVVSADGSEIYEGNENGFVEYDDPKGMQRVVFIKAKDPVLGTNEYRFLGIFKKSGTHCIDGKMFNRFVRTAASFPILRE